MEPKLQWPTSRSNWVPRARLLEDLDRASLHPVALVAAPAGYGKTTLLAQWLTRATAPRAAWVTLDAGDNDPGRLWTHVAAALTRAGCPLSTEPGGTFRPVNGADVMSAALPRMLAALSSMSHDIVIALDDFHCLQEPACHAQVQFLIENLPSQAHLMIITRADPGLRLGRLRASGGVAEIRAEHLSFTVAEAAALLTNQDVRLSEDSVVQLVKRTEGWPAGLYLATFSLAGRSDPDDFVQQFSGGNRFLGDYLTEEVLNRLTDEVRDFVTTMSILDRFTVGLCDFVADASTSAGILRDLERTNLFLVPIGPDGLWFRFHHLFAAVARSELELTHPDRVPELHARAARWFRDNGHIDQAIRHSLAAGNTGDAALLAQENWLKYLDAGRGATVNAWLEALGPPAVATDPAAGVTAAWMAALRGDPVAPGRARPVARGASSTTARCRTAPGRSSPPSAMINGLFGYAGPEELAAGVQRAVELETDEQSPYYAVAHFTAGHLAYVRGDLDAAARHAGEVLPAREGSGDHPGHVPVDRVTGRGRARGPPPQPRAGGARDGGGGRTRPARRSPVVDGVHGPGRRAGGRR